VLRNGTHILGSMRFVRSRSRGLFNQPLSLNYPRVQALPERYSNFLVVFYGSHTGCAILAVQCIGRVAAISHAARRAWRRQRKQSNSHRGYNGALGPGGPSSSALSRILWVSPTLHAAHGSSGHCFDFLRARRLIAVAHGKCRAAAEPSRASPACWRRSRPFLTARRGAVPSPPAKSMWGGGSHDLACSSWYIAVAPAASPCLGRRQRCRSRSAGHLWICGNLLAAMPRLRAGGDCRHCLRPPPAGPAPLAVVRSQPRRAFGILWRAYSAPVFLLLLFCERLSRVSGLRVVCGRLLWYPFARGSRSHSCARVSLMRHAERRAMGRPTVARPFFFRPLVILPLPYFPSGAFLVVSCALGTWHGPGSRDTGAGCGAGARLVYRCWPSAEPPCAAVGHVADAGLLFRDEFVWSRAQPSTPWIALAAAD